MGIGKEYDELTLTKFYIDIIENILSGKETPEIKSELKSQLEILKKRKLELEK